MAAGRAPAGLDRAGRAFWREVLAACEDLSAAELALLAEACRTLDSIVRLDGAVAEHGVMLPGSTGQLVLNPAIAEARLQRQQLGRLLDQLNPPTEVVRPGDVPKPGEAPKPGQVSPASARTRAARKAAAARWGKAEVAS